MSKERKRERERERAKSAACCRCLLFSPIPGLRFSSREAACDVFVGRFRLPGGGCCRSSVLSPSLSLSEEGARENETPECSFVLSPLSLFLHPRREKEAVSLLLFLAPLRAAAAAGDTTKRDRGSRVLIPSRERWWCAGSCLVFFSSFALVPLPFAVPASEEGVRDALFLLFSQSTPPISESAHRENRVRRHSIKNRTPSPRCSGGKGRD